VLSCNQNGSTIQTGLHFSNNIQGKLEQLHVGISSRARTFSTPLIFHTAYSVLLPVVIGTWISILSNSHVTSALRPESKSKRVTAASGQVVFSTRSVMFSPPCSAKGYPPSWRCHKPRQHCSGPAFPIKARLLSETLLLHHSSVNRNVRLQAVADPWCCLIVSKTFGYRWRSRLKRRARRSVRCGWRHAGPPGTRRRGARG
jgi:hypothetical protein